MPKIHAIQKASLVSESSQVGRSHFWEWLFEKRRSSDGSTSSEDSVSSNHSESKGSLSSLKSPSVSSDRSTNSSESSTFSTTTRILLSYLSPFKKQHTVLPILDLANEELPFESLRQGCKNFELHEGRNSKAKGCDLLFARFVLGSVNHSILSFLDHIPASSSRDARFYEVNRATVQKIRYILEELATVPKPAEITIDNNRNPNVQQQYKDYQQKVIEGYKKIEEALKTFDLQATGRKSALLNLLFATFLEVYSTTYIYNQGNTNIERMLGFLLPDAETGKIDDSRLHIEKSRKKMTDMAKELHGKTNEDDKSRVFFQFNNQSSSVPQVIESTLDYLNHQPDDILQMLSEIFKNLRLQSLRYIRRWLEEGKRFENAEKMTKRLLKCLLMNDNPEIILLTTQCQYLSKADTSFLSQLERSFAFTDPRVISFFDKPDLEKRDALLDALEEEELSILFERIDDGSVDENVQNAEDDLNLSDLSGSGSDVEESDVCKSTASRVQSRDSFFNTQEESQYCSVGEKGQIVHSARQNRRI